MNEYAMSEPAPSLAQLKTPPFSTEAERAVLGGLMLANQAWDDIAEIVTESDFYQKKHQLIFAAIARQAEEVQPMDLVTLSEVLDKNGQIEEVGGLQYLAQLAEETPSAANIKAYATIVRERSVLRRIIQAAQEIADSGYNTKGRSSDDLLDEAERRIMQIGDEQEKGSGLVPVNELLKSTLTKLEELLNSKGSVTGLSTGFKELDKKTAGMHAGDLIIIAARPSMGKTSFVMNLVEHVALHVDKPSLVFSLEMPSEQLMMRLLSSNGRIDQSNMRTGQMSGEEIDKFSNAMTRFKDKKLFIDDTAGISPTELRARARRVAREHGDIGLIAVDYLQLMRIPGKVESRTQEISEISRSLKAIAKEFKCPVLALSQLNRSLENRPNKRPVMSDLRESGAIEQDADVIAFIYRDEVYNEESDRKGIAEIILGKQRNGPIGTVELAWQGKYTRFENLERYDDDIPPGFE